MVDTKEEMLETVREHGLEELLEQYSPEPAMNEIVMDIISGLEKENQQLKRKVEDSLLLVEEKALKKALLYHKGQEDKMGVPYMEHVKAVAAGVQTREQKIVALLHDILEDTTCTRTVLLQEGIPAYLVDAVESMTRRSGESYQAFIERVGEDDIARPVKLSDLAHNYDKDGSRMKAAYAYYESAGLSKMPISEKTASLKKRYEKAIAYLEEVDRQRKGVER